MVPYRLFTKSVQPALLACTALGAMALTAVPALADADTDRLARIYADSGIDLFDHLADAEQGNLVLSPLSIGTALAMAYAGTRGDTATELAEILGYDWSPEAIGAVNKRLADLVTNRGDDETATISLANALHLTKLGDIVSADYRTLLADNFDAELFSGSGIEEINTWVSSKTNGRIDSILASLDPLSVAVLLNAIHFEADWADPFSAGGTTPDTFHLSPNDSVTVPTMRQVMSVRMVHDETFDAVALPYAGGKLDMIVFLPKGWGENGEMPFEVTPETYQAVLADLDDAEPQRVALSMPKFGFDYGTGLIPALKAMGLSLPFDPAHADFSGITADLNAAKRLAITQIQHKADITVDEAGTEAAAATAIGIEVTAAMPEPVSEVAIDRPFLFAIHDRTSNALLFMGRLSDPRDGTSPLAMASDQTETAEDVSVASPQMANEIVSMVDNMMAPMAASAPATRTAMAGKGMPMPSPVYAPGTGDVFASFEDGRVLSVADAPVSTFSVDVDTAAYSYVRRMLEDGALPQADAVRVEEMINYFDYGYESPEKRDVPFAVHTSLFPTPWRDGTQLLQIGIQGYRVPAEDRPPANIVFLIDTSGSMSAPDKLPLLKKSFDLLLGQLTDNDTVSIVAYAGAAGIVLEPTPASDKIAIREALSSLAPGGSTAGAAGIELAYQLAAQAETATGTNRVILATDGDFNIGIDDPDALERFIAKKRDSGISLSVLGFGSGNLDDATMQALAQNGNGTAAYIDSFAEARKVLAEEVGASLMTIARDVKVQVEFNPATIAEYRLIGYETRALNNEDFNNDAVDAGDIGSGHAVTALYEVTPVGSAAVLNDPLRYGEAGSDAPDLSGEAAFVKLRYKPGDSDASALITQPVMAADAVETVAEAGEAARFATAVAAFGQKLRDNPAVDHWSWSEIKALANSARGADENGYRAELVRLIDLAAVLDERL